MIGLGEVSEDGLKMVENMYWIYIYVLHVSYIIYGIFLIQTHIILHNLVHDLWFGTSFRFVVICWNLHKYPKRYTWYITSILPIFTILSKKCSPGASWWVVGCHEGNHRQARFVRHPRGEIFVGGFVCWCFSRREIETSWWFQKKKYFHPYLGRWSNSTNIFQMGWNHQLGKGANITNLKWWPEVPISTS